MYAYWAVFLIFPVIAAFDGTSLELLGDPANQPSLLTNVNAYMAIT